MRKKHAKLTPYLSPHHIRGNSLVWWYEDKEGIDVIFSSITTVQVRLLWKDLLLAAKRCGRLP